MGKISRAWQAFWHKSAPPIEPVAAPQTIPDAPPAAPDIPPPQTPDTPDFCTRLHALALPDANIDHDSYAESNLPPLLAQYRRLLDEASPAERDSPLGVQLAQITAQGVDFSRTFADFKRKEAVLRADIDQFGKVVAQLQQKISSGADISSYKSAFRKQMSALQKRRDAYDAEEMAVNAAIAEMAQALCALRN